MTSKLTVYNGALAWLRQRKLDTLTDDELSRYELDEQYAKALATILERSKWNFAARTVAIDSSTSVSPTFGYGYAFDKPTDFVRVIKLSGNERLFPTLDRYVDEGGYWYADVDPLYVSYVSNGATYGGDLSMWTQAAITALEMELAVRVAPRLTNMSANELEALAKNARRAAAKAASLDASNQPVEFAQPGRLNRARGGYLGRYWRDRNVQ